MRWPFRKHAVTAPEQKTSPTLLNLSAQGYRQYTSATRRKGEVTYEAAAREA